MTNIIRSHTPLLMVAKSGAAVADYASTVQTITNSGAVGAKQIILTAPIALPFDVQGGKKLLRILTNYTVGTASLSAIDSIALTRREHKGVDGDHVDTTITTTHNLVVTYGTAAKCGVITPTYLEWDKVATNGVDGGVAATSTTEYILVITLTAAATSVVTFYSFISEWERQMI